MRRARGIFAKRQELGASDPSGIFPEADNVSNRPLDHGIPQSSIVGTDKCLRRTEQ